MKSLVKIIAIGKNDIKEISEDLSVERDFFWAFPELDNPEETFNSLTKEYSFVYEDKNFEYYVRLI